jgi:pyridoxine 4-dehydrogenase
MDVTSKPAVAAGTLKLGDRIVNRMAFGAMRVCGPSIWGMPKDRDNAHDVLRRALALGVNFIDTADSYGPEVSETLIAEALHPYPKDLVIGTKGGLLRPSPPRWDVDARPEHLRRALQGSLERLRLACIDLYQLHAPDPRVPFADSVGALADAQRAGHIRHVGLSNVSVKQLEQACRIVPIVSVQNRYNFEDRADEDVLRACESKNIAFIPWYPLGAGAALRSAKVKKIAARLNATPAQVLLAWLLARSPLMLPIPGTASLSHLEENTAAASLKLSQQDITDLG